MLDKLDKAIVSLKELSERQPLLADKLLRKKGVRSLPVENYIIFYTIVKAAKMIAVLRVLYCRRDWEHIL